MWSGWQKCLITFACNVIGVYIVKWGEEKARKDKLWKIEATFRHNDEIIQELKEWAEENNIAYKYNDIVKYFIEIACDTEYSTGSGDYTVIQKWTEPIYYKVTGKPTEKDLQVLKTLCKELNSLKGFPGIYQAENGKYYNVSVNFWNCNEFYNNI